MRDLRLVPMCNHADHTEPFCEQCYSISKKSTRDPVLFESVFLPNLILADNRLQATNYVRRHRIPDTEWAYVYSVSMLRRFPEATIHCVQDELYRPDLAQICEYARLNGRKIKWE